MPPANETQAQTGQEPEEPTAPAVDEKLLSQIVNSAVSSHLKRNLGAAIASVLSKELEPIKQRLAEPPKEAEEKPDAKKPAPEIVALEKKLADMQAALRAKDEEAQAERKKARDDKAFADLCSELNGKVRPGTEKMVATLLKATGSLVVDEDGAAILKVRTSMARGQPEEDHEFPIADGVPHYLKTKDASVFLPPPTPGGAGGDRRVPAQSQPIGKRQQMPQYDSLPASAEERANRTAEQLAAMGISLADL